MWSHQIWSSHKKPRRFASIYITVFIFYAAACCRNKLPQTQQLQTTNIYDLCYSGSRIWMWLSWVLCLKVSHRSQSPQSSNREEILPRWLTLLSVASDPCWLLTSEDRPTLTVGLRASTKESKREHGTGKPQSLCNLALEVTSHHFATFFSSEGCPLV